MPDCPNAVGESSLCPQELTSFLCTPGIVSQLCPPELQVSIGDGLPSVAIRTEPQSIGQYDPVFTQPYSQLLIATTGQTVFTLQRIPERPNQTQLFVNGVKAIVNQHFTVMGDTLTWIAADVPLSENDRIEVIYK
jgi:hypothetical protein